MTTIDHPGKPQRYQRAFLAIALPIANQHEFTDCQIQLQTALHSQPLVDPFVWVAASKAHITLRFLGDSTRPQLAALVSQLAPLARQVSPFRITLAQVGSFARGQVLWLGIQHGVEALTHLAQSLELVVQQAGFPPEKRAFAAHVTLARANRRAKRSKLVQATQLLQHSTSIELKPITFEAQKISLLYSGEERNNQCYAQFATASFG